MPMPDLALSINLIVTTTTAPPPELSGWMLPVTAGTAFVCWWLHRRWRAGRWFMSRFTTHEREAAKLARAGYVFLPAAIACTALTTMFALWSAFGLVGNVWFGYVFLTLAATFLVAAGWTAKEFWRPSKRRAPEWARRL